MQNTDRNECEANGFADLAVTGMADRLIADHDLAIKEFVEGLEMIARASKRG